MNAKIREQDARDSADYAVSDLVGDLVRFRWNILVVTVFLVVAAAAYAWLAAPVYRAEVVVIPVSPDGTSSIGDIAGKLGGLASLAGIDVPRNESRDETLALLSSRDFLGKFIQELNLLPILFDSKWDREAKRWTDPSDTPTLGDGLQVLAERVLSVVEESDSSLIRVRIDWRDRAQAAIWANEIVRRLNETARERSISRAKRNIEYLEREISRQASVDLRQTLYRLLESQIRASMVAEVNPDFALRVIDPAVVPDSDKFVRPQRGLLLAAALVVGLLLGSAVAVVRGYAAAKRPTGA